jgi:hypothetical protein
MFCHAFSSGVSAVRHLCPTTANLHSRTGMLKASQRLQRAHCGSSFSKTRNPNRRPVRGDVEATCYKYMDARGRRKESLFLTPNSCSIQLHCALFAVRGQGWPGTQVMWRGRPSPAGQVNWGVSILRTMDQDWSQHSHPHADDWLDRSREDSSFRRDCSCGTERQNLRAAVIAQIARRQQSRFYFLRGEEADSEKRTQVMAGKRHS